MVNCYHWLLCLSIFFIQPPDFNTLSSEGQRLLSRRPEMQAWTEYDRGYYELCPQSLAGQRRRRECSERARQRLRDWLDKQAEACVKIEIPTDIPLTTRTCRPSADAVFSYIVRYRESE